MADQRSSNHLPLQLQAVLGSLNVNLEAELNRYRRNHLSEGSVNSDLCADLAVLDAAVLDSERIEPFVESGSRLDEGAAPRLATLSLVNIEKAAIAPSPLSPPSPLSSPPVEPLVESLGGSLGGYLESSEKLIESMMEGSPMLEVTEPETTNERSHRRTFSLLAGAVLGFFGLVAGLGMSSLISNPTAIQQLARNLQFKDTAIALASEDSFDPPGPDLSASEFITLDIDNLSSLKMPQTAMSSVSVSPPVLSALPPIPSQPATGTQPTGAQTLEVQPTGMPTAANYYVTAPFLTEQSLIEIRQSVDEAFVRRFADGNRIQLAAFDNSNSAQQFGETLKRQGIVAQVYGPTTE